MNPAVRSRVPILVRIERTESGHIHFRWFLRRPRWNRKNRAKEWYWKSWRGYVAYRGMPWREALAEYRNYAEYWRTGTW